MVTKCFNPSSRYSDNLSQIPCRYVGIIISDRKSWRWKSMFFYWLIRRKISRWSRFWPSKLRKMPSCASFSRLKTYFFGKVDYAFCTKSRQKWQNVVRRGFESHRHHFFTLSQSRFGAITYNLGPFLRFFYPKNNKKWIKIREKNEILEKKREKSPKNGETGIEDPQIGIDHPFKNRPKHRLAKKQKINWVMIRVSKQDPEKIDFCFTVSKQALEKVDSYFIFWNETVKI